MSVKSSGTHEPRRRFAPNGRRLFCTGKPGYTNCVSVFALTGRLLFLHRKAGGTRTAAGGFALSGRHLSLHRPSGDVPRPAAGAKRKGHLRFSFLFELLPFPCFLIWRRLPTCDRSEKEYGRGFFLCYGRTTFGVRPLEQPIRRVRYRTATHTVNSTQARHTRAAQILGTL